MSNTINLFMWGYQQYFWALAKGRAEDLFQSLDKNLTPRLFLIGFLQRERDDRHPICLEPEECGYTPNDFAKILLRVPHFRAADAEANLIHSHPIAQAEGQKRLETRATIAAIKEVLEAGDSASEWLFFVSTPALIEDFQVFVVLQFPKEPWEKHPKLQKSTDNWGRFSLTTSLLVGVVDQFLAACQRDLFLPDAGRDFGRGMQEAEIVRAGGRSLLQTVNLSVNNYPIDLFNVCNGISAMRYEGAEGLGQMLLAKRGHVNIKVDLLLLSPVLISDLRAIRKLLEITSGEVALLSDGEHIYGLGSQTGFYDSSQEDLFCVTFTKHYHWELTHADDLMMQVSYEAPRLPRLRLDEPKFRADIPRIFPGTNPQHIESLWQLVSSAIEQKHGTMVVISADAQAEAHRLSKQCIAIEPTPLTPKMMELVTAIDGSVLIDPHATCHAIGVILDGLASQNGTSARGARYNSAIRYMEGRKECLVVVVSEDGSIDLIPDLRPQLPRSVIEALLGNLRWVEAQESIDETAFNRTMRDLQTIRFYLDQQQCEEVNQLRKSIKARIPMDANRAYIVHPDLVPDPEFNESYLVD